jgi:ferritin
MVETDRDSESKAEAVETLKEQLTIEGQLVGLYDEYERKSENKAMKRVMQMFRLDSQRHINIIQAAIEIIQGEEVYIEDRGPLKETFKKHLALEAEALKKANSILRNLWVDENQGLKNLLQMWRDDEKRHHAALKTIISKPYFRMASNDFVSMFRDEKFLEERHRTAERFKEKYKST